MSEPPEKETTPAGAGEGGNGGGAEGLSAYTDIPYLDPETASFSRDIGGFLRLEYQGETYEQVVVRRAFPFRHGDDYLSVRDKEGKEIGMIALLERFPGDTVALLRDELDRRYFMPRITRIDAIKEEFGYTYWSVETDRGPRTITVRGLDESVHLLDSERFLIVDVDGSRFIIDPISSLDAASTRRLELFL